jgi:hypothetical protein
MHAGQYFPAAHEQVAQVPDEHQLPAAHEAHWIAADTHRGASATVSAATSSSSC